MSGVSVLPPPITPVSAGSIPRVITGINASPANIAGAAQQNITAGTLTTALNVATPGVLEIAGCSNLSAVTLSPFRYQITINGVVFVNFTTNIAHTEQLCVVGSAVQSSVGIAVALTSIPFQTLLIETMGDGVNAIIEFHRYYLTT